jgi:hypothetical protein
MSGLSSKIYVAFFLGLTAVIASGCCTAPAMNLQ